MNGYRVTKDGQITRPWRLPMLLLLLFMALMTLMAVLGSSARAGAADDSAATTLAIIKRACEIEGGHLDYNFNLREDGSIESISTSCSVLGGAMCNIWEDGEFICVRKNEPGSIQDQVKPGAATTGQNAPADNPTPAAPTFPTGESAPRVDSRGSGAPNPTSTPAAENGRG